MWCPDPHWPQSHGSSYGKFRRMSHPLGCGCEIVEEEKSCHLLLLLLLTVPNGREGGAVWAESWSHNGTLKPDSGHRGSRREMPWLFSKVHSVFVADSSWLNGLSVHNRRRLLFGQTKWSKIVWAWAVLYRTFCAVAFLFFSAHQAPDSWSKKSIPMMEGRKRWLPNCAFQKKRRRNLYLRSQIGARDKFCAEGNGAVGGKGVTFSLKKVSLVWSFFLPSF